MVFSIARRYAFSSKNRHRLTSIRIAIGLLFSTLALNVIISFMIGLQDNKFSLIREYVSYDAVVELNQDLDTDEYLSKLNENEKIDFAFKFIELPTIVTDNDNSQFFGKIRAFNKEDFEKLPYSFIKGSSDKDGIIFGYSNSLNSNFDYNKYVEFTILKKGKTVTIVPYQSEKQISGIYFTPLGDFNNNYILSNYDSIKKIAPYSTDIIGVYGDVDTIRTIIGDNGSVSSWKDQNESLYAAMKLEQYLMYLTLSLISIIVLIHLYNSTVNLIHSKTKEIAMLRALGLTKKQIKNIFTISSLIVGTTGILLGSILSFVVLYFSSSIIGFLNLITSYQIPLLTVNINLNFSITNCLIIAIPLFVITFIMSHRAIYKLLKNDSMEILLNE